MLTLPAPRTHWILSFAETLDRASRYTRSGQYVDAFVEFIQAARIAPDEVSRTCALEQAATCEDLAAGDAAGDAAWAAAGDALAPTVATLQASASELVRRMVAITDTAEV